MKVLNLDALAAKSSKTVELGGRTYAVKEMTVEDFITANNEAKDLESKVGDPAEWVGSTVRFITRSIPEMTEKTVRKLSVEQMAVLVKFINGELAAEAENAASETSPVGKPPETEMTAQ